MKRVLLTKNVKPELSNYLLSSGYNCSFVDNETTLVSEIAKLKYDFLIFSGRALSENELKDLRQCCPALGIILINKMGSTHGDPLVRCMSGEFFEEIKIGLEALNLKRSELLETINEAWGLERKLEEQNRELDVEFLLKTMGPRLEREFSCEAIYWLEGEELIKFLQAKQEEANQFKGQITFRIFTADDKSGVTKIKKSIFSWSTEMFANSPEWVVDKDEYLIQPVYMIGKLMGCVCYYKPNFDVVKRISHSPFFQLFKSKLNIFGVITEYKNKTNIDFLTDLYNQKYLNEVLDKNIKIFQRDGLPFSVLFIDVDHFKKVNDVHGHLVGSHVLKLMGDVLKNAVRVYDYVFRYGGDEFIVVLNNSDEAVSQMVAERLRKSIEQSVFKFENINLNVTVSIGVSIFPQHANSATELIKLADKAMYYGKSRSRNIVYIAS